MVKWETSVSDSYLREIGRIVVSFSALETELSEWIGSLILAEGEAARIVTAEMSFSNKLALAGSLARYKFKDSEKLDQLEKLIRRIKLAEEKRNHVIHSYWTMGAKKTGVRRYKTTAKLKQGLRFHFQEMSVSELNEIANFISDVVYDTVKYEMTMYDD